MKIKAFIQENLVLVIGLSLPIVLIVGFLVASGIPQTLADPPKYDFVFSVDDYSYGASAAPIGVRLVVKDGSLVAQYIRHDTTTPSYISWKKIYIYEAATQKVRELPFGYPADIDSITDMREETVEALKGQRIDTTLQSPDGYELSWDGYSHSGLVNEFLWGSHSREPRLRKDGSSVRLTTGDGRTAFYYGGVQFVGWVIP